MLGHVVSVLEDDQARETHGQTYTQILCKLLEVSVSAAESCHSQ